MPKIARINYISLAIVLVLAIALTFLYLLQRQDLYEYTKKINHKLTEEDIKHYDSLTNQWSETLRTLVSDKDFQGYINALSKGQKTQHYKRKLETRFSKISANGINKIQMIRFIDHLGEEKIVTKGGNVFDKYRQLNDENLFRLGMITPAGELSKVAFDAQKNQSYLHRSIPVIVKNKRLGLLTISIDIKTLADRYAYLLIANIIDAVALLSPQGQVLYHAGLLPGKTEMAAVVDLMDQNTSSASLLEHEKNLWSTIKNKEYGFSLLFFSNGERMTKQLNTEYIKLSIVLFISFFAMIFLITKTKRGASPEPLKNSAEPDDVITQQRSHNFLSISDEIRQPINALLGSLSTLSETQLDTSQSDYVLTAKSSATRLQALVNQFQDYSKIMRGEFELDNIEFDLRSTVHDIAELISVEAYKKGLEVSCLVSADVPSRVFGDVTRLRQVMTNLASYAVRYTANGEISFYLSSENHSPNTKHIRIEISDTGNIMDQETMSQQIEMFTTISDLDINGEAHYSGEGLGLALSKQLIELMSGDIELSENNLGGNTFRIHLPFNVVAEPVQAQPQINIDGKRILLAGEIEKSRDSLTQTFAQWGMSGVAMEEFDRVANILREAYISQQPFDLCLIDVSHSSSSDKAFELLSQIRQEFCAEDIALVVLTAQGEPGDARRARELGAQAYLTKPISIDEIHSIMQNIIRAEPENTTELLTKHTLKEGERQNAQRVLLVEYDETVRKHLLKGFNQSSILVDFLNDNAQLDVAINSNVYHSIFIDTTLPGVDVIKFVETFRQKEATQTTRTRIIGLIKAREEGRTQEYLAAGMDDVLCKPIDYLKLAVCISNHISTKPANPKNTQTKPT